MKKIGLIGGMSYESTIAYYEGINRKIGERLGGLSSGEILLSSLNFDEIEQRQKEGEWDKAGKILASHARILQGGGADYIFLCTNTMHGCYEAINAAISVTFVHIADATLGELRKHGVQKVGLLGTIYTMTQDFYKRRLIEGGVEVLVPNADEMEAVNEIIFDELCPGKILSRSKEKFLQIIEGLRARGAQGAILGCTEIGLLVSQADTAARLFDTTQIHIDAAVNLALGE